MTKRFYFILIFVFAVSALLLGLSYSKDSGTDIDLKLIQNTDDYFRVVYSKENKLNKKDNKIDFGVSNITNKDLDYVIKIINKGKNAIYYRLDGEKEKTLGNEVVFTATIKKKGTDGDYNLHRLEITNQDDFNAVVEVALLDNSLKTYMLNSPDVFKDSKHNLRYFGLEVNNYIKVDNNLYRIIGLIDNKLRLVGEPTVIASYVASNTYLTVEDYVLSFDKHNLNEKNVLGNNSWLNSEYRYWLESDNDVKAKLVDADVGVSIDPKGKVHYQRFVREINGNVKVTGGNGTSSSPYEVSYGSK